MFLIEEKWEKWEKVQLSGFFPITPSDFSSSMTESPGPSLTPKPLRAQKAEG